MKKDNPQILVVGISGSLREGSYTHLSIEFALKGAEESGANTRMLDLNAYQLPFTKE